VTPSRSPSAAVSPLVALPNTYRAFYGAFTALRPIQQQAIEPILAGRDLLCQSATGSGKTEAVLAPVLERAIRSGRAETAVYVVPTRALALDLERRLAPAFERLGLGLAVRTGDLKRAGGGAPDLLLTTPESLDVALGSPSADLRRFLARVRTVVVDELHPLLHEYRGRQLACLLTRLERRTGPLQRIGLSATIAEPEAALAFFGFRPDAVRLLEPVQREILPHLVHLQDDDELVSMLEDLAGRFGHRKVLLFANSRGRCDALFGLLSDGGPFRGRTELHYSNLRPRERRAVEHRFRRRDRALCIATSTLELGIDIGDVDAVLLFEPPESVSGFLQRLGRANRREAATRFWGVCRGGRADEQLVRFLALLELARAGLVEAPPVRRLPSVLVQQTLSCLYEQRRVSLRALQSLFPADAAELARIVPHMLHSGWLRPTRPRTLLRGSWRYRDAFLERRLFSNLPDTGEAFALEVEQEAVADLPPALVAQLKAGDRVQLAGRRLRVLEVGQGAERRVLAERSADPEVKELLWFGPGGRVSYEAAQAMGRVLRMPDEAASDPALGLFRRPRRLLLERLERARRTVTLQSGIEVGRTRGGAFRYFTFLGSAANLLLRWAIVEAHAGDDGEPALEVASDEISFECSAWIDLRRLELPGDRASLSAWVVRHLGALRSALPLNAFAAALPPRLLADEVADFLYDPRVLEVFARYRLAPPEIVAGDPRWLEPEAQRKPDTEWLPAAAAEPLLAREQRRRAAAAWRRRELPAFTRHQPRSLTGTRIGGFLRREQCARWLSREHLPPELLPPTAARADDELANRRAEQGRRHEERVLHWLREGGQRIVEIAERDAAGRPRPLQERFDETLARLASAVQGGSELLLVHPVLRVPAVLKKSGVPWQRTSDEAGRAQSPAAEQGAEAAGQGENLGLAEIEGVGIPDLLRVVHEPQTHGARLEVIDVKDASRVRYAHQWQVAFYAVLLGELVREGRIPGASAAGTGGLWLRPPPAGIEPELHRFELAPFLSAFPALARRMTGILQAGPAAAQWRLGAHCTSCPWFDDCYREALATEEVQLVAGLRPSELARLRRLGLASLEQAAAHLEPGRTPADGGVFAPHERESLAARIQALLQNRIGQRQRSTRRVPPGVTTALFLHALADPVTGQPLAAGVAAAGAVEGLWVWDTAEAPAARAALAQRLSELWRAAIADGRGPHLFSFGGVQPLEAFGLAADPELWFLSDPAHHTDLRRLLAECFDFPAPGRLTLFAAGRLLGLRPELPEPASLLDPDPPGGEALAGVEAVLRVQTQLWQWLQTRLAAAGGAAGWSAPGQAGSAPGEAYRSFLEEERRRRREDVLALQELPLEERVARGRALGPLRFVQTVLDAEGHFLHELDGAPGPTRFREEDFLRLVPAGSDDFESAAPVVLAGHDRVTGRVRLRSRRGPLAPSRHMAYSLEEEPSDASTPKLLHVVRRVFDEGHPAARLFEGQAPPPPEAAASGWVRRWQARMGRSLGLNEVQLRALELPFHSALGLVEGPPGTGKTHLLAWTIIALFEHARDSGAELRIAVTALTHRAIDEVLERVAALLERHGVLAFPCLKWGRQAARGHPGVERLGGADELLGARRALVGATGYGLYELLGAKSGAFPRVFDWVVFDEASQLLVPQALLGLVHGKGGFLFVGDDRQLPPVVLGDYQDAAARGVPVARSVLTQMLERHDPSRRVRLELSYRMNDVICAFPSRAWYGGTLRPAAEVAGARLRLEGPRPGDLVDRLLEPERPCSLVLLDDPGGAPGAEVELLVEMALRLLREHALAAERLAVITPHRARNNAVLARLAERLGPEAPLPLVDTVERMQGSEREVVLAALVGGSADESEFLNDPNRFNVALSRARTKLVVVGGRPLFCDVPRSAAALQANAGFKAFQEYCRERDALFEL
jgi:superfamily II DNA/RNA helicase